MILLTGANGQLGTAFRALLPEVITPDRAVLDLSRPGDLETAVSRLEPRAIVNCAAYTAVDTAETDEETAQTVNGTSVGVLAEQAARLGIPFVTFSTDYVFDGTASSPYLESSAPHPINAYGRSKLLGEQAALAANPDALVVRSSWLFSATHRNFVSTILGRAATSDVDVVADQIGCPTYAPDLAAATLRAMENGVSGLLHLTNVGEASWFDLARAACELSGVDPERVRPITTEQYPTRARRPRYSPLGSERRRPLGLADLRPWREALGDALHASDHSI